LPIQDGIRSRAQAMTRATLDALRDASGPMTTQELARHVMAERGSTRLTYRCCSFSPGALARCCGGSASAASFDASRIRSTVGSIFGNSGLRHGKT
jgi:hypothetical protein